MMSAWRARLNQRLGEQVFLQAQRDILGGEALRNTTGTAVARALSVAILCLPPLVILFSGWLIWWSGFAWTAILIGGILMACALFLLPRRERLPDHSYSPEDLPALFALVQAVNDQMDGPGVDRIVLTDHLNAFAQRTDKSRARVLGFGLPLWHVLTGPERVAVIAHELAHFQNGDPHRTGVIHHALVTLERWMYLLSPEQRAVGLMWDIDDHRAAQPIAELLMLPFLAGLTGLHHLLERLTYLENQRAEYLADTIGAQVSGRAAAISTLETVQMAPEAHLALARAYPGPGSTGIGLLDSLRTAMRNPPAHTREKILEAMRAEKSSVDQTHPPTAHRIAFLELAPLQDAPATDFDALVAAATTEMLPHAERIGMDLLETRRSS